jgi:transglutaminase-like putative cysteine protease
MGVALGLGTVLFTSVSLYRGELTQWGNALLLGQGSQITGLTTAPLLGRATDIRNSFTRALRVEGASAALYLRSMSFTTYDAGGWLPTANERRLVRPTPADLRAETPGRRLRITRLGASLGFIVAPLETAGIQAAVGPLTWSEDRAGPLRTEQAPPSTYGIVLSPDAKGGLFAAPPGPEERRMLLAVTDQLDPHVPKLARKVAGQAASPRERVRAVERYLQGAHGYSLKADPPGGEPVSTFLLERRPGHCEYFASAAVLLLRCLGVPARYVTGFYAWERTGPREVTVRERDAHAWAEAWVEGQGWVTVDATPAGGRPDGSAAAVPPWTRALEWAQDRAVEVLPLAANGLLALTASAGLFLVGRYAARRLRRLPRPKRRGPRPYTVPAPDLAACAARFDRLLARTGHPCPPDHTWEEHLEALSGAGDAFDLQTARRFVRDYYAVRFGGGGAQALVPLLRTLEQSAPHTASPTRGGIQRRAAEDAEKTAVSSGAL